MNEEAKGNDEVEGILFNLLFSSRVTASDNNDDVEEEEVEEKKEEEEEKSNWRR